MAEESKPEKRKRDLLGEENPSDPRRDVREGVPYAPDDKVFKRRRRLHKDGPFLARDQIPLADKRPRQLDHFFVFEAGLGFAKQRTMLLKVVTRAVDNHLQKNGSACRTHSTVGTSPACQTSCGARKMQKTMQSR